MHVRERLALGVARKSVGYTKITEFIERSRPTLILGFTHLYGRMLMLVRRRAAWGAGRRPARPPAGINSPGPLRRAGGRPSIGLGRSGPAAVGPLFSRPALAVRIFRARTSKPGSDGTGSGGGDSGGSYFYSGSVAGPARPGSSQQAPRFGCHHRSHRRGIRPCCCGNATQRHPATAMRADTTTQRNCCRRQARAPSIHPSVYR